MKVLISAVARVFEPGCKVDTVLVLEGPQGIGKSTAVRILASDEWFADTSINLGDKDSFQALRGKWLYEFSELASFSRSEANRAKNFLSAQWDCFRESYGRRTKDGPRHCIICGTTNDSTYLNDTTGNRRYWPMPCTSIDLAALQRDREQLWAEAVARYHRGDKWHAVEADFIADATEQQEARVTEDVLTTKVRHWLASPIAKRDPRGVTTDEVLAGIGYETTQLTNPLQKRVGGIFQRLGYVARQVREPGPGNVRARRYALVTPGGDSGGLE